MDLTKREPVRVSPHGKVVYLAAPVVALSAGDGTTSQASAVTQGGTAVTKHSDPRHPSSLPADRGWFRGSGPGRPARSRPGSRPCRASARAIPLKPCARYAHGSGVAPLPPEIHHYQTHPKLP